MHLKGSKYARPLQKRKLAGHNAETLRDFWKMEVNTSKTKKFCETSSSFDIDNVNNKAIRPDFLQVELCDGLAPTRFAILSTPSV